MIIDNNQLRCQLCFYEKYKYIDNIEEFSWDYIARVIYFSDEIVNCSICFRQPCLPRMTKCGHVYCLLCLMKLLLKRDCVSMSCCVCDEQVEISLRCVKRVSIVIQRERGVPKIGDMITLDLLVRDRPGTQPRLASSLHPYSITPIARSRSFLTNSTGIGIDDDSFVISSIKWDIKKLEEKREKMTSMEVVVSMELQVVDETINGLRKELSRLEGYWWREIAWRKGKRLEEAEVFNLLRLDEYSGTRELFFCDRDNWGVFLMGGQRDSLLALRDGQENSPPVSVKGRIVRMYETGGAVVRGVPFEGALLTLVELDVGKPDFEVTYADEDTLAQLRQQKEVVCVERERCERFKEHMAAIAIERMNISNNSCRSQRISRGGYKMMPRAVRMLTPRIPIIGRPLVLTPSHQQQQYCSRNRYPIMNPGMVFNTCMVGIECVDPDDEYPHAEKCQFYSRMMINESRL